MKAKVTLEETVDLMLSEDPVEQFKGEYYQLVNRIIALDEELMIYDLNPENSESRMNAERNLLGEKMNSMRNYLLCLQREAKLKDITL